MCLHGSDTGAWPGMNPLEDMGRQVPVTQKPALSVSCRVDALIERNGFGRKKRRREPEFLKYSVENGH